MSSIKNSNIVKENTTESKNTIKIKKSSSKVNEGIDIPEATKVKENKPKKTKKTKIKKRKKRKELVLDEINHNGKLYYKTKFNTLYDDKTNIVGYVLDGKIIFHNK